MIKDKLTKISRIVDTINSRISEINRRYRAGPDLYFYRKLVQLRREAREITSFVNSTYNLEMLYATLVSWDMNSRAAKMKYFDEFVLNLKSCEEEFKILDSINRAPRFQSMPYQVLRQTYEKLHLMKTDSKLVSNSKLLHFLFPHILMPMDRQNTLVYFYGNTSESIHKYLELIGMSFEILAQQHNWNQYLDDKWNQTAPKLIDNAVILLVGKSVK
jgi:hypothetical protein